MPQNTQDDLIPEPTPEKATPKGSGPVKRSIMPLFFSLVALGLATFAVYQTFSFTSKVAALQKYSHQDYVKFMELKAEFALISESHASLQTQLSQLIHNIRASSRYQTTTNLTVKEAINVLEFANIEATSIKNPQTCLILLERADKLLQSIQITSLDPIIEKIKNLMQVIRSEATVDSANLLQQINQLQAELFANLTSQLESTSTVQQPNAKGLLKKLVVVKLHDPNGANDTPSHNSVLINQIILNMQTATTGLLQNNHKIYSESLNQAEQNIKLAFAHDAKQQKEFLAIITKLQEVKFSETPSIQEPIDLLKNWLDTNSSTPLPTDETKAPQP